MVARGWADEVADLLRAARRVFVLTGAGMSTESGIPDFRGPNGLWTRNPQAMRMFDLDAYRADPEVRRMAWQMRLASEIRTAEANPGHQALADWEQPGREVVVATQNIDGLQQQAGSSRVLELHGSYWESMCLTCDDRRPIQQTFERVEAGDGDPSCLVCGGILKTGTVAFGQPLDPRILGAAVDAARMCDVALAIGTSLVVQPAASLCAVAVNGGAPLVIVTDGETPFDDMAEVVVRDRIGSCLMQVTELVARGAAGGAGRRQSEDAG